PPGSHRLHAIFGGGLRVQASATAEPNRRSVSNGRRSRSGAFRERPLDPRHVTLQELARCVSGKEPPVAAQANIEPAGVGERAKGGPGEMPSRGDGLPALQPDIADDQSPLVGWIIAADLPRHVPEIRKYGRGKTPLAREPPFQQSGD